jgi:hypothetical protein
MCRELLDSGKNTPEPAKQPESGKAVPAAPAKI